MPQLEQLDTYISQIFWLLVTFGILYFMMSRVLIPRMVSILEARVFQVESDQRRAEETRLEAEEFGSRIAYMVSNAQMDGERMRTDASVEEREKTEKRLAEIERQIAAKIADSEMRLAEQHDRQLRDAEAEIAEVVQKVLGKVLGEPLGESSGESSGSASSVSADEVRRCVREQLESLPKAQTHTQAQGGRSKRRSSERGGEGGGEGEQNGREGSA